MSEEQRATYRKLLATVRYYYFADGSQYFANQHMLRIAEDSLNYFLRDFPEDVVEQERARIDFDKGVTQ